MSENNFNQVVPMTKEELREVYNKLTKEELIEMLMANNSAWGFVKPEVFISPTTPIPDCDHQWQPLPSPTTGVHRYQCLRCGRVRESSAGDCFSTNAYPFQKINNK